MERDIDPKVLENGKVLQGLIYMFNENRCVETLLPMLSCLRDSIICVPTNAIMTETDQERILNLLGFEPGKSPTEEEMKEANEKIQRGIVFQNHDQIRMKPDILKSPDDKLWFPIFTNEEAIETEYKKQFSIINMPALEALNMAHNTENVEGLVLNAHTDGVVLTYELADLMLKMDSRLKGEE